jgi:hypothetical protein
MRGKARLRARRLRRSPSSCGRSLTPIPNDLRGLRDRALILAGFAGALRRSELAAIRVEQLEKTECGLRLTLHQTKGLQTDAVIVLPP